MKSEITSRVLKEAHYIIDTKKTLRDIAKVFGVSKSTVHKDLKDRLKDIDLSLYKPVSNILSEHKEIRHIRGGQATRKKYLKVVK